MSRLRVLLAIKGLGYGGAERILVDMVAAHERSALEVEVAYIMEGNGALAPALEHQGTPVHCLGARSSADLTWLRSLRHLLVRGRFDVVHFHLPYTAALGRLVVATLSRRSRPAVVYTEHSLWNRASLAVRAINRIGVNRDQALFVVSEAARDALPRRLRPRAEVLLHGVDVSRADELIGRRQEVRSRLRAELGGGPEDVVTVTVANLRAEKGYDVLLEASSLLVRGDSPVIVAAVGHGPLESELKRRHAELGLGERFRFLGQRDDVLTVLAGADMFVLASRQEGLPVALMEATSVGVPVVATAVGGVPTVLADGMDAIVVPPGDPEALASALQQLATDVELRQRLGEAARDKSTVFDVTTATRRVEDVYRQLAAGRAEAGASSRASEHTRSSATGKS